MKIGLLGDICLSNEISELELSKSFGKIFDGFWLGNLETPIINKNATSRPKAGPILQGSSPLLNHFKKYFCSLNFNLANNHIMDFGDMGLKDTIDLCYKYGIGAVGAGINLQRAQEPLILNIREHKFAILGCCETQFGIANANRAGVNPINPRLNKIINDFSQTVDAVIISIHGAAEMSPWPSPKWQDLLRSFVDAGARIVHGHHAHVPQGYECYNGGLITYGLGNFLVDPKAWETHTNTLWSLMIVADLLAPAEKFSVQTNVVEINGGKVCVRKSTDEEFQEHSAYLLKCNEPLKDRPLLEGLWQEAAVRMFNLWFANRFGYRDRLTGRNYFRALYRRIKHTILASSKPSQEQLLFWYHLFACESHCDAISTALGLLSGELDDLRVMETRNLADDMMPWSIIKGDKY